MGVRCGKPDRPKDVGIRLVLALLESPSVVEASRLECAAGVVAMAEMFACRIELFRSGDVELGNGACGSDAGWVSPPGPGEDSGVLFLRHA